MRRTTIGLKRQSRRQTITDVLLWIALSLCAAAMGPDPFHSPGAFAALTVPRLLLAAVVVVIGRPWPLLAVVLLLPLGPWSFSEGVVTTNITWPVTLTELKLFPLTATSLFSAWYAYLSGRRTAGGRWTVAAFGVVAFWGCALVVFRGGELRWWITMVTGLVGTYAVPYALGVFRRLLLQQRADNRRSVEEQARLRERARIARDMHDSLGHALALIAVRAAGLELSPDLSPAHAKAATDLREAAGEATERLRQIIGILGEDPAPLTPVDESVTDLVERARSSGMTITLTAEEPIPQVAHAVVQEALTNAAKHAPGAAVDITVTPTRIEVHNAPPPRRAVANPGGTGLTALAERVRLSGGTLTAEPTSDGGFHLLVTL